MTSKINEAIRKGLAPLREPEPLRLSEWARLHFYLSAESSYVEGAFDPYPFQVPIMDAISNDDIKEVWIAKSARLGYTKIILASMLYHAHHKRRNQVLWQPVDDDADEFVKTELDPAFRDVSVMHEVFPWRDSQHRNNTLRQKVFIGSMLHIRGGRAAKNYRRLSVDVAYFDELDGFEPDVEGEGDPVTLGSKRVEGATFPKVVGGSTPRLADLSMIDFRFRNAEQKFRFYVPCPHCNHEQYFVWGGKDEPRGLKWESGKPSTAAYLCEACGALFSQSQYLQTYHKGRYKNPDTGIWIDSSGFFRDSEDNLIDTPLSVGFHIWTLYSPMISWSQIVREFMAAHEDTDRFKTFVNTTLGEPWQEEGESADPGIILSRREEYTIDDLQDVTICAGIDVQKDRLEVTVAAFGQKEECWILEHVIIPGETTERGVWAGLDDLFHDYSVVRAVVDSGYNTGVVYEYCASKGWVYPAKGIPGPRPLVEDERKRRQRLRQRRKRTIAPEPIGVDQGKSLVYSRLKLQTPGPNYIHFPDHPSIDTEYADQLTAERLITRRRNGRVIQTWEQIRKRNEALDCLIYAFSAYRLGAPVSYQFASAKPAISVPIAPRKPKRESAGGFARDEWAL